MHPSLSRRGALRKGGGGNRPMSKSRSKRLFAGAGVPATGAWSVACGSDSKSGGSSSSSSSSSSASGKKVKVGFIYVGTVDDGGYNQAAYQGELAVKKMDNVETVHAENVPENAEAERVMEQ